MTNIITELGQDKVLAEHALKAGPAQKWAGVVDDRPIPLPRQRVSAQVIKDQAAIPEGFVLLRDYETRNDVRIPDDAEVNLAEGNCFRAVPRCEAVTATLCHEPPKLAFFLDDDWEVTVNGRQTGASILRFFDRPAETQLLRDYESPHDQPIADDDEVNFGDGPVFRSEHFTITVKVNKNPVIFHKCRVTGLFIKQTAIAQGVKIPLDGVLYPVKSDGSLGTAIGDSEKVDLEECEEFRCVTPDDNS
jgi:hypothetical protein